MPTYVSSTVSAQMTMIQTLNSSTNMCERHFFSRYAGLGLIGTELLLTVFKLAQLVAETFAKPFTIALSKLNKSRLVAWNNAIQLKQTVDEVKQIGQALGYSLGLAWTVPEKNIALHVKLGFVPNSVPTPGATLVTAVNNQPLQAEKLQLTTEIATLKQELTKSNSEKATVASDKSKIELEVVNLQKQKGALEKEIETLSKNRADLQEHHDDLHGQVTSLQPALQALQSALGSAKSPQKKTVTKTNEANTTVEATG